MALRVFLVGLAVSMGFELPNGQDVESWARTGGRWVGERLADLSELRAGAERSFAEAIESDPTEEFTRTPMVNNEPASIRDDLTFDAVVEGMVSNFAADLSSIEGVGAFESKLVAIESGLEMPEETCLGPEVEADGSEGAGLVQSPMVETNSQVEKISSAIRLTREAVGAWVSLIQPSAVRVDDHEEFDSF